MNIRQATALFTSRRYFLRSTWTDVRLFFPHLLQNLPHFFTLPLAIKYICNARGQIIFYCRDQNLTTVCRSLHTAHAERL